jgi:PAS domain S-box-containing protein
MAKKSRIKSKSFDEKLFRALLENAHDGIVLYDARGKIKFASPSTHKFGGYKQKDLIGRAAGEFVHPLDLPRLRKLFSELKPDDTVTMTYRLLHKKGYYRWTESILTNKLHIPEIGGIVNNFRDIDDRKKAEGKAEEYRLILESVTENVHEGIFLGALGKKLLYANPAFLKILGYSSFYELQKIDPQRLYADADQRKSLFKELEKQGVLRDVEIQLYHRSGRKIWCKLNASFLKQEDSTFQFLGTVQDITEQRETELESRNSRQLLTSISNNVQEGFFRSTPDNGLLYVNDSFVKIFDYTSREEVLKTNPDKFFANPADRVKLIKIQKRKRKISNVEVLYKRKDGGTFWGSLSSTMFHEDDGGWRMDGVILDITDLKKREDSIHELNSNLAAIIESTTNSIYAIDVNYHYLAFNDNHRKIMRLLYGKDINVGDNYLTHLKGTSDEEWFVSQVKPAFKGRAFIKEYRVTYPKYKNRDVRISFNPILDNKSKVHGVALFVEDITEQKQIESRANKLLDNLTALLESTNDRIFSVDKDLRYLIYNHAHALRANHASGKKIKAGDRITNVFQKKTYPTMEPHLRRALAGEYFTTEISLPNESIVEASHSPVKNKEGEITGAATFVRDITQRKLNERKIQMLNDELVNQNWKLATQEEDLKAALEKLSERNFELDQFMYKTSHDLRSPLSSVLGLINLAKLTSDKPTLMEYIEKIEGRIKKLDEFVRSMLNYAKVSRAEITPGNVDIGELIDACLKELEYLENFRNLQVIVDCKGKPALRTDAMTLRLVFANIISNAYKYYNPNVESHLKISVEIKALKAIIRFSDNGIGIRKEYLDKIFNMFFRATEKSEGSGLGMYIVKQAVDKLKGTIEIDSEYGVGTSIQVVIPNL